MEEIIQSIIQCMSTMPASKSGYVTPVLLLSHSLSSLTGRYDSELQVPMFQPLIPPGHAPIGLGDTISNDSEELDLTYTCHPGFELPPLDLELFHMALKTDPILEPTPAEVAPHLFLRSLM